MWHIYLGTAGFNLSILYDIGKVSYEWKIANVVSVHKKRDSQILKNYQLVSLLFIWGKS